MIHLAIFCSCINHPPTTHGDMLVLYRYGGETVAQNRGYINS